MQGEQLEEKALLAVVSVDSSAYVSEGSSTMLNFHRDTTQGELIVYISTMTATVEPEDFSLMPDDSVTFYDGFDTASTYIFGNYDMDADNEEFYVYLSYGTDYTIDPYASAAWVTIDDPDVSATPNVWLDNNTITVDEGNSAEVFFRRDTTVGELTINYQATDLSAESADYYFMSTGATNGWATFWDGYDTASDWLYTSDDSDGDDEQSSVDLSPSPDYNIMGEATITIVDHEAPVATNNDYFTPEDTPVVGNVLTDDTGNGVDFDPNGDPLTVDTNPMGTPYFGTVTLAADGSFTYIPVSNYCGYDSFGYYVWDNEGGYAYGTVTVTMNPINDVPEAYDAEYMTSEDMPAYGSINYYDVDGDSLIVSIATGGEPKHGDVRFEDYGTYSYFTYTPEPNYYGPDSFTFKAQDPSNAFDTGTVNITVYSINDAPVAAADTAFTEQNQPVTIANLLANDSDVDGDLLMIASVDSYSANMGTIVNNGDGTILYTPAWDFTGSDSFTYMATDNMGGYAYATVSVTVIDGPMVWMDTQPVTIAETGSVPITLHRNRSEGELMVTLYTYGMTAETEDYWVAGAASFGDGQTEVDIWPFAYDDNDPDDEVFYVGIMDAGSYAVDWSQSQAGITIDDDDPQSVWFDNGMSLTVAENSSLSLMLYRNTTESDLTVNFQAVNQSAEAGDYAISPANSTTFSDGSSSTMITLTAEDDADGDDEVVSIELVPPGDGSYAPGMYAWVTIEDREPPVAAILSYLTAQDGVLTGNLVNDDTGNGTSGDPNGDILSVDPTPTFYPANGDLSLSANGDFTYTPYLGFTGFDSFGYIIVDSDGLSTTAMATIEVSNTPPVVVDDENMTFQDEALTVAVLENDFDMDGDPLFVLDVDYISVHGGMSVVNQDGTVTYTPPPGFTGNDTFSYTVSDGNSSASGNVSVAVFPVGSIMVTNTKDDGLGSLRDAMVFANQHLEDAIIQFNIPSTDSGFEAVGDFGKAFIIRPITPLPTIDNPNSSITIDGWSQTNFGGDSNPFGPEIVLDGANGVDVGLVVNPDYNLIRGLNIHSFVDKGIVIAGHGNQVAGNYIGTDPTGSLDRGMHGAVGWGVEIMSFAQSNVIGTDGDGINDAFEGNVISGNDAAVVIEGADNIVAGNLVGTDRTGTLPLGNFVGIEIVNGGSGNRIGSDGNSVSDALERNIISGNDSFGILISDHDSDQNVVAGNYIGTNITGMDAIGNTSFGVWVGPNAGFNRIGTDGDGFGDESERNIVSANRWGIGLEGPHDTQVAGNYIGVDPTGHGPLGNSENGIYIDAFGSAEIGGTAPGMANVVAYNTGPGVRISSYSEGGVAILSNSIFANDGLGIDIGESGEFGPTLNDPGDEDIGVVNFPVLQSVVISSDDTVVTGTLNSTADTDFYIEFFSNDSADPSGYGQGQNLIGSTVVTTDGDGNGGFSVSLPVVLAPVQLISATATDLSTNNTSEFSMSIAAEAADTNPLAADDLIVVNIADEEVVAVLLNDNDGNGGVSVTDLDIADTVGIVTDLGRGNYSYRAPIDFTGVDTFQYTVSDQTGNTDTATVYVVVDEPVESQPAVAVGADGSAVVVWVNEASGVAGIFAQRYAPNGAAVGDVFRVDDGLSRPSSPAVGLDAEGKFVVAWEGFVEGKTEIFLRHFDGDNSPIGSTSSPHDGDEAGHAPSLAMSDDGRFVLSWTDPGGNGQARLYEDFLNLSNSFELRDPSDGVAVVSRDAQSVALLPDGGFVAAFTQSSDGYVQQFDDVGTRVGQPVLISGSVDPQGVSIDTDDAGNFVVAWSSNDGSQDVILARRYDAELESFGQEFILARESDIEADVSAFSHARIAVDGDGEFVVTAIYSLNGQSEKQAFARWYNADGTAQGPMEAIVGADDVSIVRPRNATVATNSKGDFVAAWTQYTDSGTGTVVQVDRFQLNQAPTFNQIPRIRLDEFTSTRTLDLYQLFDDVDLPFGDELEFVIVRNTDPNVVTATISDEMLATERQGDEWGELLIDVQAIDTAGHATTGTIEVRAASVDAPELDHQLTDGTGTVTEVFRYIFSEDTFSDPNSGDTLTYSATLADGSELPGWLNFVPQQRMFIGTPDHGDVGDVDVNVTATDSEGNWARGGFKIPVRNRLRVSLSKDIVWEGETLDISVTRADGSSDDLLLTYSFSDASEAAFDIDGELIGVRALPCQTTGHNVSIQTRNDGKFDGPQLVRLRVSAPGYEPTDVEFTVMDLAPNTGNLSVAKNVFSTHPDDPDSTFFDAAVVGSLEPSQVRIINGQAEGVYQVKLQQGQIVSAILGSDLYSGFSTAIVFDDEGHSANYLSPFEVPKSGTYYVLGPYTSSSFLILQALETVRISGGSIFLTESNGYEATIGVSRDGDLAYPLHVQLEIVGGTAWAYQSFHGGPDQPGGDYEHQLGVTIPPGSTSATASLKAQPDVLEEGTETLIIGIREDTPINFSQRVGSGIGGPLGTWPAYTFEDTFVSGIIGDHYDPGDLDIDSNNTGSIERSSSEDEIEDDPRFPGKMVLAGSFTPVVYEVGTSIPVDVEKAVFRVGSTTGTSLWRKDGNITTVNPNPVNAADPDDRGDRIAASYHLGGNNVENGWYTGEQLGISASTNSTTLYLQGLVSGEISIEMLSDGIHGDPNLLCYEDPGDLVRTYPEYVNSLSDGDHYFWNACYSFFGDYYRIDQDVVRYTVMPKTNLGVDSNNDGELTLHPGGGDELIEHEDDKPGQIFGRGAMIPLSFSVAQIDEQFGDMKVRFTYDGADPSDDDSGSLRLWTAEEGGQYVEPGVTYSASFFFESNFDFNTLYIEGVQLGKESITVEMAPNGDFSGPFGSEDTVDVTVVETQTVSIAATDLYSQESATVVDDATFVISRGEGNTSGDLTVYYRVIPGAGLSDGGDVVALRDPNIPEGQTGKVTIREGESAATVSVIPLDDDWFEWDETLQLSIIADPNFQEAGIDFAGPFYIADAGTASATVTILDDDGVSGLIQRNVDFSSTSLQADAISNGTIGVGIEEGQVEILLRYQSGIIGPNYRSNDNLHPIIAVDFDVPAGTGVESQSLTAELTFAGLPSSYFFSSAEVPVDDVGTTWRITMLGPESLDTLLRTGHYEYDVEIQLGSRVRTVRGGTEIVNLLDDELGTAEFGKRWWIDGLDRLVPSDSINGPANGLETVSRLGPLGAATENGLALIRGDNTSAWYRMEIGEAETVNDFASPPMSEGWELGTHTSENGSESGFGGDYFITTAGSGQSLSWTFDGLDSHRRYQVFTTWVPDGGRSSAVPFTVSDAYEFGGAGTTRAITVDQRYTPGETVHAGHQWRSLGFYLPENNAITISIDPTISSEGQVVADAVMLVSDWDYGEPPQGSVAELESIDFDAVDDQGNTEHVYGNGLNGKYGDTQFFDHWGLLRRSEDRNSNETRYIYADKDGDGRRDELVEIALQGGLSFIYEYESGARLSKITDYAGREVNFSTSGYTEVNTTDDIDQKPDEENAANDASVSFSYGGRDGLLSRVTDAAGNTTQIEYGSNDPDVDSPFTVQQVTNGDEGVWRFTPFLVDGLGTRIVKAPTGKIGEFYEDDAGSDGVVFAEPRAMYQDARSVASGEEYFWTYQTDSFGLLTAKSAPATTDSEGEAVHDENVWTWERNGHGLVKKFTEPKGGGGMLNFSSQLITEYDYDDKLNLKEIKYAQDKAQGGGKITESWTYDNSYSQLSSYTDPEGRTTTYNLDPFTLNVDSIDENGQRTTKFDEYTPSPQNINDVPGGLVVKVTVAYGSPDAVTTKYDYYGSSEENNHVGLVKKTTFALDSGVEQFSFHTYDDNRNPKIVTNDPTVADQPGTPRDEFERTIRYKYDDLNRLIEEKGLATSQHGEPITTYEHYGDGRLKSIKDAAENVTEYEYDAMGRIELVKLPESGGNPETDQTRPETKYEYDENGNLLKEKVLVGGGNYRVTQHQYDQRNLRVKSSFEDPGYDLQAAWLDWSGQNIRPVIVFAYDTLSNLKWQTDPRFGEDPETTIRTEHAYDKLHRLTQVTSPAPVGASQTPETKYEYYDDSQIRRITAPGPNGNTVTEFQYDNLGRLQIQINPDDGNGQQLTVTRDYDRRDNLSQVTESGGGKSRVTTSYYDKLDRIIAVDGPDAGSNNPGISTYYSYNPAGKVAAQLVFAGNVDDSGHVSDGQITESEIDSQRSSVWQRTDGNNIAQKTKFTYDALGRVMETTGPDAARGNGPIKQLITRYAYNIVGNVDNTIILDAAGSFEPLATNTHYDALGRLWSTTYDFEAPATEIAYNVDGTIKFQQTENANGGWNKTEYGYDKLGRVNATTINDDADQEDGLLTSFVWRDALGSVTKSLNPFGLETYTSYDNSGHVDTQWIERSEAYFGNQSHADAFLTTGFLYNTDGSLRFQGMSSKEPGTPLASGDYDYGFTKLEYDDLGRVEKQTRKLNGNDDEITKFGYDVFGYQTRVTDPRSNITSFTVDNLGRIVGTELKDPEQGSFPGPDFDRTSSSYYDAFGNLRKSLDRNDRTIFYEYDNLGRRTREIWDGDSYTADYIYTALGELEEAKDSDAAGAISEYDYDYDSARRLEELTQALRPLETGIVDFIYQHDLLGNVTHLAANLPGTADDYEIGYQYDNLGRTTRVEQSGSVQEKTVTFHHEYGSNVGGPVLATEIRRYNNATGAGTPVLSTLRESVPNGPTTLIHQTDGDIATPGTTGSTIQLMEFKYDPRQLLARQTTTKLNAAGTLETTTVVNEYDQTGQLSAVTTTLPDGNQVTVPIQFDAAGNPADSTIIGVHNRLLQDSHHAYEYDDEGNLEYRWTFGAAVAVTGSTIDDEQLKTNAREWDSGTYQIEFNSLLFDDTGSFDSNEDDGIQATITISDSVVATIANIPIAWDEDLDKWVPDVPGPVWFTIAGELTGEMVIEFDYVASTAFDPDVSPGSSFTVDQSDELQHFEWDYRNRRVKATIYTDTDFGASSITRTFPPTGESRTLHEHISKEFTYDVHDRLIGEERMEQTEQGSVTVNHTAVWERDQQVWDHTHDASQQDIYTNRLYEPGVDRILAVEKTPTLVAPNSARVAWVLTDHQGTATGFKFFYNGRVEYKEFDYSPFGAPDEAIFGITPSYEAWEMADTLNVYYAGREYDWDTGLSYNRARWYAPDAQRFISADPIGFAAGDTNLYRYAGNSPGNATDPSGHIATTLVGTGVGGAIGAASYLWFSEDFTWGGFWAATGKGALYGAAIGSGVGVIAGLAGYGSAAAAGAYGVGTLAVGAGVGAGRAAATSYVADPAASAGSLVLDAFAGAGSGLVNPYGEFAGAAGSLVGAGIGAFGGGGRAGFLAGGIVGDIAGSAYGAATLAKLGQTGLSWKTALAVESAGTVGGASIGGNLGGLDGAIAGANYGRIGTNIALHLGHAGQAWYNAPRGTSQTFDVASTFRNGRFREVTLRPGTVLERAFEEGVNRPVGSFTTRGVTARRVTSTQTAIDGLGLKGTSNVRPNRVTALEVTERIRVKVGPIEGGGKRAYQYVIDESDLGKLRRLLGRTRILE